MVPLVIAITTFGAAWEALCTFKDDALVLLPQALLDFTETEPPDEFGITVMEFVVEIPVHPEGKVQM